ncbi:gamma-glutamyl-gamma-aminobutyrate hydrolase family protein [Isoptericola sp. b441]|uniref:Gamma-glutamyl-gamma-aminobutyrate hydrolase family protein n=1 Tax=Actinotalea lenta TaxID=3064654 RepID=A0ABT9DEM5_9CELL|nr:MULTISPECIES: gamma-glutamyl-gamma-aminobutyrate hydrolase family protein [unclassified Isoptericola]MDO8107908.1 gamma-glutamyl-gamma-aminobutyrate hydrolase family protein [Isoptericola sp. b441]MDO8120424.1 gamma-glutamyl-gamma-aminobutyrate hydrolase family protein [Isoptericola sp. b490]
MNPRRALVLQHVPWEGPGLIGEALASHGVAMEHRIVVDRPHPRLPRPAELAALVVMGGPMGALDDVAHPGLAAERKLLADCVAAGTPVLGVCLGMQLLAVALGGELVPGHATEIGFGPVDVIAPDPVLAPLGPEPSVLHWHDDAVGLPPGAEPLARTAMTPVQAFRAGSALGLQFHLEVDSALLAAWLASGEMPAELAEHGITDLPEQAEIALPVLEPGARRGLASFAAQARDRV